MAEIQMSDIEVEIGLYTYISCYAHMNVNLNDRNF